MNKDRIEAEATIERLKAENEDLAAKCNHIMAEHGKLLNEVEGLRKDAERLDYVLTNRNHRVQGSDAKGWCVLDCSNGLTFIVRNAQTARAAIDAAMPSNH